MTIIDAFTAFLQEFNTDIHYDLVDNTVQFNWDSCNFVLFYNQDDPLYFRLMLPRVASYSEDNQNKLDSIALALATKYKVGKAIRVNHDGTLWLSVECFLSSLHVDNSRLFIRAMRILKSMLNEFRDRYYSDQGTSAIVTEETPESMEA